VARQRRAREHPGRDPRRGRERAHRRGRDPRRGRERAHRPGRDRRRARAGCPGRVPRPAGRDGALRPGRRARRGQERAGRDGTGAGQTAAHPARCCLPVLRHRALSRTGRPARAGWPHACRAPMSCRRGARRREHGSPEYGNRENANREYGSWTGGRAQTGRRSRTGARFRPRRDPGTGPGRPARYRRGTPRAGRIARELFPGKHRCPTSLPVPVTHSCRGPNPLFHGRCPGRGENCCPGKLLSPVTPLRPGKNLPPGRSLPRRRGRGRARRGGPPPGRLAPGPVTRPRPGCAAWTRCPGGHQRCQPAGRCFRHRRPGPPPSAPRRPRLYHRARLHHRARQHRTGPGRPRRHGHAQHRWSVPGSGPRREPCSGRVPRRRNGRRPGPARLPRSLLRSSSLMATMAPRLTGRAPGDDPAFSGNSPRRNPAAETSLTETLGPDNAVEAAPCWERPQLKMSGSVLLSHAVPRAVPSALKGLTSGFGMEPGVSPSPWPPKLYGDVGTVPAEREPRPGTAPTAPREPHSGRET
jgi:hypothetical protein